MYEIKDNYQLMFSNIKKHFTEYLSKSLKLKSLVIGLSGGIDSALTCILANEIIKEVPDVELIGRSLPIETNKPDEILRAQNIGSVFCDDFKTCDLTDAYKDLYGQIVSKNRKKDLSIDEKIRKGNIKARIRMIYLFDLAHYSSGMVLSTDNLTEMMLGFWTLHGDVGNFGLLQYLWKTEVYGLARYLESEFRRKGKPVKADALRDSIDAVPTDGLGITTSDFDQIKVPDYETADKILIDFLNGSLENKDHPVVKRCNSTEFKRLDPVNIKRENICP